MSLWVKICANTSLEDALLAADAGADAVGFVFAPSPRRVTHEQVAGIVPQLPAALEKIGVFVDASFEEIAAIVESTCITGVQLHFDAELALTAKLRSKFGSALRILRVVHFGGEGLDSKLLDDPNADAILVDSSTASAVGGTGVAFDWASARKSVFQRATARTRLIAAGGLKPENVIEAIETLRPWGVDIVSGVEATAGRKDPDKVRAFIANARSVGPSK